MSSPAPPPGSSPGSEAPPQPSGSGPYPPRGALLGGLPTPGVDVPICGVFILIFVCSAVFNMTVLTTNRRRGHKFVMSGLLFGFSMARITTCVMRIVWATRPTNVNVAIASNIFNQAGVLILFIVNLIFAQRLVRAYQPRFGWHRAVGLVFRFLFFSVVALLIMVITATVRSFFTLDPGVLGICRDIQLFSGTYLTVLAFLPIPIVLAAWAWPRREPLEKFGQGRFRTKVRLVLFTATLLAFGAGFRLGGSYAPHRPATDPAWYHHKAAFYCVNFVIEVIVLYLYSLMRFDRRFHVPDGSSAPGHYSGGVPKSEEGSIARHINTEAEAYGDDGSATARGDSGERTADEAWERRVQDDLEKQDRGEPIAL